MVAFASAGGWAPADDAYRHTLALQTEMQHQLKTAAPYASAILSSPQGRRRVTGYLATNWEHLPADVLAHLMLGAAACPAAADLIALAARHE